jgi:putative ABC transport system permease protein
VLLLPGVSAPEVPPVRFLDILGLSLSALFKQKIRTLLTTLGVMCGSCVLVVSLSIGQGVQETVVRQYQKYGELRTINVSTEYVPDLDNTEAREVIGQMSEEKRKRLEKEMSQREKYDQPMKPKALLTREKFQAIANLEHVELIEPVWTVQAWAVMGDQSELCLIAGASAFEEDLPGRIVAGSYFADENSQSLLVSEYLLYKFGITDDADVQKIIGQKLRLEIRESETRSGLMLGFAFDIQGKVNTVEERILEKVVKQLPAAVDRFDLTDPEKVFFQKMLKRSTVVEEVKKPRTVVELPIRGVLKQAEEEQQGKYWGFYASSTDILLPRQTADKFYISLPFGADGYSQAIVKVDSLDHVKEVNEQIEALGFSTRTPIRYIEREQFVYLMIFSVMSIVAAVALLVAALGITNTMFMSVLERVREIGIMKAVGARKRHIQIIFLLEGAVIGLIGGGLGLLSGWLISFPGDAWASGTVEQRLEIKLDQSIFVFPIWLMVGVPLFVCVVTTLAAVLPARRAVGVNPITALRHE